MKKVVAAFKACKRGGTISTPRSKNKMSFWTSASWNTFVIKNDKLTTSLNAAEARLLFDALHDFVTSYDARTA